MTLKVVAITSGTSWMVPSDWNNASNNVYCIGAGGGAGGNGTYSGSGGGGAFAIVANISLTPGNSVTVAIGAAGSAGIYPSTAEMVEIPASAARQAALALAELRAEQVERVQEEGGASDTSFDDKTFLRRQRWRQRRRRHGGGGAGGRMALAEMVAPAAVLGAMAAAAAVKQWFCGSSVTLATGGAQGNSYSTCDARWRERHERRRWRWRERRIIGNFAHAYNAIARRMTATAGGTHTRLRAGRRRLKFGIGQYGRPRRQLSATARAAAGRVWKSGPRNVLTLARPAIIAHLNASRWLSPAASAGSFAHTYNAASSSSISLLDSVRDRSRTRTTRRHCIGFMC